MRKNKPKGKLIKRLHLLKFRSTLTLTNVVKIKLRRSIKVLSLLLGAVGATIALDVVEFESGSNLII